MKKITSERTIAACLFIITFVVFSFAQKDSQKNEMTGSSSSILPETNSTAINTTAPFTQRDSILLK